MKFENTEVMNFTGAMRGMRNPLESWAKNDTYYCDKENGQPVGNDRYIHIGPNDLELAQKLINGGPEHRKFLRQIFVCVDITAPLFWFKEFDTYKVGTVANSTSTMHKLTSKPITLECFEIDDYREDNVEEIQSNFIEPMINYLEELRLKYNRTKDKWIWKELVRWLPESWLQTRTVTMNYENIRTMIHQRENHKLNEWSGKDNPFLDNFISWASTLPYSKELLFD